jgi:hypothetical protein
MEERLFQARLAEHVSARDEMISAISNQHLVLTFGTASIVAVMVAGFLTWKQPADPGIFLAVAPLSAWVLSMWLAEVVRMFRSVAFCREQADAINASITANDHDYPPIRWESWRDDAGPSQTVIWTYASVVVAHSVFYAAGVALGLVVAKWSALVTVAITLVFALGLGLLLAAVGKVFLHWAATRETVGMPPRAMLWAQTLLKLGILKRSVPVSPQPDKETPAKTK